MKLIFLLILNFLFAFSVQAAESSVPVAGSKNISGSSNSGGSEALLQTLDETLAENRKLKEQLKQAESRNSQSTKETELLKSQVRTLQKQQAERLDLNNQTSEKLRSQLKELKKENKKLEESLMKTDKAKDENLKAISDLKAKILSLENTAKRAIPESQKRDLLEKIESANSAEKKAYMELVDSLRANENFKKELGQNYYRLGNMNFELQRYKKAAEYYQMSLALTPNDPATNYNLAVVSDFYLNDQLSAMDYYKRYLIASPNDEAAKKVQERLLELELGQLVVPPAPLDKDYHINRREVELRLPESQE